ncbi:MAG TPA: hypothetical protein ENN06_09020 [Desulfobacteraceae bacterium]|nr:hypothetical protein [Desulfobacteraceae bacterium]
MKILFIAGIALIIGANIGTCVLELIPNAHTVFNVTVSLVFLPFVGLIIAVLQRIDAQADAQGLFRP